jgi:hypothetical protein
MIKLRSLYTLTFTHKKNNTHKADHERNSLFSVCRNPNSDSLQKTRRLSVLAFFTISSM